LTEQFLTVNFVNRSVPPVALDSADIGIIEQFTGKETDFSADSPIFFVTFPLKNGCLSEINQKSQ
jgi:hypothetical protein